NTLTAAFGPFYAPAEALIEIVGRGDSWTLEEAAPLSGEAIETIASRLRGASLLACGQLVDEGVSTPTDTDIGARVGLRWRQGPFELANALGVARAEADV
ncbi:MAG: hypothetical protein QF464_16535, partial [Myxococcota bacterium]|nr:hypothetical protein [Myxococcota bacterium]